MEGDVLKKQIVEDNAYFKKVLDLIPLDFYFGKETSQMHLATVELDDAEPSKAKKRERDGLSEHAAWKRKKYDPSLIKTVSQLQEHIMETDQITKLKSTASSKKRSGTEPHSLQSDGSDLLHQRLHGIIDEKKAKREASKKHGGQDKKMKRRLSKMKLKQRRRAEKQVNGQPNQAKGQTLSNGGKSPGNLKSPAKKPIYNNNGKMVFSKFDFTDSASKHKPDAPTGKNYKKLLEVAERQKEKLDKLKETDQSKAKVLAEKTQWKHVLQRAEGVKVKDDPELLKKALRKKEKRKDKRKEAWGERADKVKGQLKEKQDKRKGNIAKRKQGRVDKKIKKAKKKGRIIPGF